MTIVLARLMLIAVVLLPPAQGDAPRPAMPSAPLALSLAIDAGAACVAGRGEAGERFTVRLRFTNRTGVSLRVRPAMGGLAHVQVVRTVEEFVPMGPDTPGVAMVRAPGGGAIDMPRPLPPGASIDVERTLEVHLRGRGAGGNADTLEPGDYFLELVGVLDVTPLDPDGPDRFRQVSVVSPYVGVAIGRAAANARCPDASQ